MAGRAGAGSLARDVVVDCRAAGFAAEQVLERIHAGRLPLHGSLQALIDTAATAWVLADRLDAGLPCPRRALELCVEVADRTVDEWRWAAADPDVAACLLSCNGCVETLGAVLDSVFER